MKRYIIVLVVVLFSARSFSQEANLSETIISAAEELAADEDDPEAVSIYTERLQELAENPVKINSSSEAEISRLFFLSDFQIKALADYTHSSGRILSVYELASIPGFDQETAELIIPFITLEYKPKNNSDTLFWRNSLISNFSIKTGKKDTSSLGSDWKILTRYKFTAGAFSGGITTEKDPGEKFLSGSPSLPDFFSANIAYNGSGLIKRIIIGDYSARFGQGTNINTGIRKGISLTSQGYMSAMDEINSYTSTDENRFFRGVAAELSARHLEVSMFFSINHADATISQSLDSSGDYVENFYTAGMHNTPSLLKKKDAVSVMTYGTSFSYNFNNLKVGLVWSENMFSLPVNLKGNDPDKIFDFKGDRNTICSVYYNSLIRKILLYGEFSLDADKQYAVVQGVSFRPSDRLMLNFLFRNYEPGYTTFFGLGPGASSKTTNEKGVLGNFSFEAAKHLFLSGGFDIQHFDWLKYRCSAPSLGVKKELKIRFLPSERLTFDASYNYRLTVTDNADAEGIPDQMNIITRSLKASARYSMHNCLTLGTQINYKNVSSSGGSGFLLFQEIEYNFRHIPLTLWARYCIFNTDNWASRIYTYENDLLYSYSIPALSGEGSRSYIMGKWKTGKTSELRIKYGITSLITTGKSIENTNEIKMQFRIWF